MSKSSDVTKKSLVLIVGSVVGLILQYLGKLVFARWLGPDSYGVYVQALAVVQFSALLAVLGLNRGIPRFISYYLEEDESYVHNSIFTGFLIALILSSAFTVALWLNASNLANFFNEPQIANVIRIFSLAIPPFAGIYLLRSFMQGLQNTVYKVYMEDIIQSALTLLIGGGLLYLGFDLIGAVYGFLVGTLIATIAGFYFISQLFDIEWSGAEFIPKELIMFSWPLLIVSLMDVFNQKIDIYMIGWLLDSSSVGIYDVAMSLTYAVNMVPVAFGYMVLPKISELQAKEDIEGIRMTYKSAARWISMIIFPMLAGFLIFPEQILLLLFGEAYIGGSKVMIALAVGFITAAITGPASSVLTGLGRTKQVMSSFLLLGFVDVVLNYILIPKFGILGAAIGMASGFALAAVLELIFLYKGFNIHPYSRRFRNTFLSILIPSIIFYLLKLYIEPNVVQSLGMGIMLVVVYSSLLFVFGGFSEKEKRQVEQIPKSLSDRLF